MDRAVPPFSCYYTMIFPGVQDNQPDNSLKTAAGIIPIVCRPGLFPEDRQTSRRQKLFHRTRSRHVRYFLPELLSDAMMSLANYLYEKQDSITDPKKIKNKAEKC